MQNLTFREMGAILNRPIKGQFDKPAQPPPVRQRATDRNKALVVALLQLYGDKLSPEQRARLTAHPEEADALLREFVIRGVRR
jgi:hypothetical protein